MTDSMEIAEYSINVYRALQKPWELAKFLDVIAYRDPKVIFEIGVSLGGSLWAMAKKLQGPRTFVSIDLPNGPFGGSGITDEEIKQIVSIANREAKCKVLRGDSKEVKIPAGVVPDLVFIDGDHTLSGVMADWIKYFPLVNTKGMIVFHDIVEHPLETGVEVNKLWKELEKSDLYNTHAIIETIGGPWGGIGIVYV